VHEIVAHGLLLLQMVAQGQDHLLQRLDAFTGLLLDGLHFRLGGGLALLLNGDGLAEDSVFLDNARVVRVQRLERVFQARLVLFEGFNQRGLFLHDAVQFVAGGAAAAVRISNRS